MISLSRQISPEVTDNLARTPLSQVVFVLILFTALKLGVLLLTRGRVRAGITDALDSFLISGALVFMLVRPFWFQTFWIPSGSMLPALELHDTLIADKGVYRRTEPQFQDIVVFRPPNIAHEEGQPKVDFIKRLIGLPGDTIEISGGVLYRNGRAVMEPYIKPGIASADFRLVFDGERILPLNVYPEGVNCRLPDVAPEFFVDERDYERQDWLNGLPSVKIPAGYFLFCGDNRNGSYDGRAWGLVPRRDIIGRAAFRFFPFSRAKRL